MKSPVTETWQSRKGYLDERDFIAINRAKIYPVLWDKQRLGYVTPKVDS